MTNDFRMDAGAAAREAVKQGVKKFWLDRIACMVSHVMYRGNMNRGFHPVSIVEVKVANAGSWPLKGTITVVDAENRRFGLTMNRAREFKITEYLR